MVTASRYILLVNAILMRAAAAEVTGGELLATCRAALTHGYHGTDSVMCDWYVNPCGVCGGPTVKAQWCLTPGMRDAELATLVVHALEQAPNALTRGAKGLVRETLQRRFPCPEAISVPQ